MENMNNVCTVCAGDHYTLLNCPQLLDFLPGPSACTLPDTVCTICLKCAGGTKCSHKVPPKNTCHLSEMHILLCRVCPCHAEQQKKFKLHFAKQGGSRKTTPHAMQTPDQPSVGSQKEVATGSSTTIHMTEKDAEDYTHDTCRCKKSPHTAGAGNKRILEEHMLSIIVLLCIVGIISIITFANTMQGHVDLV